MSICKSETEETKAYGLQYLMYRDIVRDFYTKEYKQLQVDIAVCKRKGDYARIIELNTDLKNLYELYNKMICIIKEKEDCIIELSKCLSSWSLESLYRDNQRNRKLEKERLEQERLEKERLEKERLEKEEKERLEKERASEQSSVVDETTGVKKERKKKEAIPKSVRSHVWNLYIGPTINEHRCLCCKKAIIKITDFDCGHVIAESAGGTHEIGNLRPICSACNHAMGSQNMIEFVVKYGYYIG